VPAAIVTDSLTKDFGPVRAVDALDLEVREGEVFGFLGPNGAGKTTTIRLLLDFLRPTGGEARVLGGRGGDPEVRRRIGYLPADLHLDPRYTGEDVFAFFGALRGSVDRGRLDQLVDRFGLDAARPLGELSTGNRRKVGIVQAFMARPDLLVLDEPTSGLDPLLQHEFLTLVAETVAEGATVFLSSHVLPEVERVASRVAILRGGRLVTVAGVHELRARARQRVELQLAPGDAADGEAVARFRGVPGVVEAASRGDTVEVTFEGSVDPVLKAAATLSVERITTREADLDEVFLDFYREES
jgi:ABC-2 type transport system ATP-binding protein